MYRDGSKPFDSFSFLLTSLIGAFEKRGGADEGREELKVIL